MGLTVIDACVAQHWIRLASLRHRSEDDERMTEALRRYDERQEGRRWAK